MKRHSGTFGRLLLGMIASLGLWDCAGTETGNPGVTTQLALNAHSSEPASVAVRDSEGGIVVEHVWLSLGNIAFTEGAACESSMSRFATPALGIGDHAHPSPAFAAVELPEGAYGCLTTSLKPAPDALPEGAPAELTGHSVLVSGKLDDGTPFSIFSSLDDEVAVPALNEVYLIDPEQNAFLLGFDVARWFGNLELQNAERDEGGVIVVDSGSNAEIADRFRMNLPLGLELYRDKDADGELDENPELVGRGAQ